MLSDAPRQRKKTWDELALAASKETDPEKIATIAEEMFAALEERERSVRMQTENPKPSKYPDYTH
ncbi:MAG: hypothetical protein HY010_09970 [Acidobacteria bacterium]|nr:hypothetical protein [Acidobacteriota bacterium]